MNALIAFLVLLLAGCAYTPQVTVLFGERQSEGVKELSGTLLVLQPFGKRGHGVCGALHDSELANGRPLNDNAEITFDKPACGFQWGGKSR